MVTPAAFIVTDVLPGFLALHFLGFSFVKGIFIRSLKSQSIGSDDEQPSLVGDL